MDRKSSELSKGANIAGWILRIIPALILLQTLFFKFTGAEEAVYIFTQLGVEPWGRIASGMVELVTALMLIVPATAWLGALLGMGLMAGAIGSHLTVLGISVNGDGGALFIMGIIVLICCAAVLFMQRQRVPVLSRVFA